MIVPTLHGNASTDALRSALKGTQSVPGCIPTRSVGMIGRCHCGGRCGFTEVPNVLPIRVLVAAGVARPT